MASRGGGRGSGQVKAQGRVDQTSVFIRGIPAGTADAALRSWLEARVGPVVTCFAIREDYGLAKFKSEADARRCLEDFKNVDFEGRGALHFEAAKPKRGPPWAPAPRPRSAAEDPTAAAAAAAAAAGAEPRAAPAASSSTAVLGRGAGVEGLGTDLRHVQLWGVPQDLSKEALRTWVEGKLPGGCGLEALRRAFGEDDGGGSGGRSFVVSFRKEQNARRCVEALNGASLEGSRVTANFRALALSRRTTKAGRLIVRNLAFAATEKHVRKAFQTLGELVEVRVPLKVQTKCDAGDAGETSQEHKGFAFVQYADVANAEKAIARLNGCKICGRGVAVDWAVDAKVYGSLSREDRFQQEQNQQPTKRPKSAKREKGAAEKGEDGEEAGTPKNEVRRMRSLFGEDQEDSQEEDSDDEKGKEQPPVTKKPAGKGNICLSPRKPGFDVDQGRTVFVRNVPFDATDADVRETLQRFGKVKSVKLVADKTGENKHTGSAFVQFLDQQGADAALATDAEADKKLKELSAVVKRGERRELPAVEGFGVSLKGRRLVLKPAVAPNDLADVLKDRKPEKGAALKNKRQWMHLLHVGEVKENSDAWQRLSKSEQRQRQQGAKERKWRINNSNFTIDPLRLSIRNLPRFVNVAQLRETVVKHLSEQMPASASRKQRTRESQGLIVKASLVRDPDRRTAENQRRSRGFGFVAFKDHPSAMRVLQFLNDNPKVFGGNRRPIVEFAVEDKRKLRMQHELYQKHAHKLLNNNAGAVFKQGAKDGASTTNARSDGAELGPIDQAANGAAKRRQRKKPTESRGRRQRQKRREQKTADAERAKAKEAVQFARAQRQKRVAEERTATRSKKRNLRFEPDAGPSTKKFRSARPGELADDFELRALQRFREGGHM